MFLLRKIFKTLIDFDYHHNPLKFFLIEMKPLRRENFVSLKSN